MVVFVLMVHAMHPLQDVYDFAKEEWTGAVQAVHLARPHRSREILAREILE